MFAEFLSKIECFGSTVQSLTWHLSTLQNSVSFKEVNGNIELLQNISSPQTLSISLRYEGLDVKSQTMLLVLEVIERDESWPKKLNFTSEIQVTEVDEGSKVELVRLGYPFSDIDKPTFSVIGCNCDLKSLAVNGQSIFSTPYLDYDNDVSTLTNIQVLAQFGNAGQIFEISTKIKIKNVNDHIPFCGGINNYLRSSITESYHNATIDHFEIDLLVVDLDQAPFNSSNQTLFAGNTLAQSIIEHFELISSNGKVFLRSAEGAIIDLEKQRNTDGDMLQNNTHALFLVEVYDTNSTELQSTCTIDLEILDVNEYHPVCETIPSPMEVREGLNKPRDVARLECNDKDATKGPGLRFHLSEGLDYFEIQETTGVIFTIADFDYEHQQTIEIIIAIGNGELNITKTEMINVLNVNDEKPYFENFRKRIVLQG